MIPLIPSIDTSFNRICRQTRPVRALIDGFAGIPNTTGLQVDVCKNTIAWAVQEKTVFLRQALETKLVSL